MSVALIRPDASPVVLYQGEAESANAEFIQLQSGTIAIPDSDPISVSVALTLNNMGCSLIVEQAGENIMSLTFGANYSPSAHLRLNNGSYAYISLDVSNECG